MMDLAAIPCSVYGATEHLQSADANVEGRMVVHEDRSVASFRCAVVPERERVRVVPVGDVDLATAPSVERELQTLSAAGFSQIVLDLRETTFIDSSGLHVVLRWAEAARQDGYAFSVIPGPRQVQRLFEISGVTDRVSFVSGANGDGRVVGDAG